MSDKFRVTLSDGTVCVFYYWSREDTIVVTQPSIQAGSEFRLISIVSGPVSYTHLTLPTIYSV